jgi:hypothetical protein
MTGRTLDVAFWDYDRTRALSDGRVEISGVATRFHSARIVPQIFEAMIRQRAYDVAELGLTYFLRTFADGPSPFLAIPVFPNRAFRHAAIYVSASSGIRHPEDLVDRTIGELALYGHDAGVMAKGILSDEFGFKPERNRWIIGGIDFPIDPIDFVPHPRPDEVLVTMASKDTDLGVMLEAGEIDALISADVPRCVLEGSPKVRHLFPDHEAVERDYYCRTGIFPIMHTIVVTRDLAEQEPEIVRAVYNGFWQAKDAASAGLTHAMTFNNMATMLPWLTNLLVRDRDLLGDDWWPYGMAKNCAAVDAVLRYHHEQGLTSRRLTAEEVFVPYLMDA